LRQLALACLGWHQSSIAVGNGETANFWANRWLNGETFLFVQSALWVADISYPCTLYTLNAKTERLPFSLILFYSGLMLGLAIMQIHVKAVPLSVSRTRAATKQR
jgi:hypothetical protein